MWKAFLNCWKIPEIRKRILFTIGVLILCRVAANIPCPGIDMDGLNDLFKQLKGESGTAEVSTMLNLFTGGALQKFAVAGLGIMPYITASIIMSLISPVLPIVEKWKREGETGYQKITQWTRYLTLVICVVQGSMFASAMANPNKLFSLSGNVQTVSPFMQDHPTWFIVQSVIVLMCGTMLLMWMGEQITEKGIGQGASLIITIGIIARLPQALYTLIEGVRYGDEITGESQITIVHLFILLAVFVLVTAAIVALTVGVRKIPVQYARARAGRSGGIGGGGGQGSFFPLKVNFAGVMPIIFGSTLLMVPGLLLGKLPSWESRPDWVDDLAGWIAPAFQYGTTGYMLIFAALIIFFCFFWVSSQFNPVKVADDLKRSNAYVPGYRPGADTAHHLDWTMTRVTTAGATFLTIVALLPMLFIRVVDVQPIVAQFFGGTSMLIMVGVVLDTMRQLETYMITHGGYETFMKKGRIRGRGGVPVPGAPQGG